MWLREVGPPLEHWYPGLPDLRTLSPLDIAARVAWRHQALTAPPDPDGDLDWDDAEG